jgi:hypothetical protein
MTQHIQHPIANVDYIHRKMSKLNDELKTCHNFLPKNNESQNTTSKDKLCNLCASNDICFNVKCECCNASLCCIDCINNIQNRTFAMASEQTCFKNTNTLTKVLKYDKETTYLYKFSYPCPFCRNVNLVDPKTLTKDEIINFTFRDFLHFDYIAEQNMKLKRSIEAYMIDLDHVGLQNVDEKNAEKIRYCNESLPYLVERYQSIEIENQELYEEMKDKNDEIKKLKDELEAKNTEIKNLKTENSKALYILDFKTKYLEVFNQITEERNIEINNMFYNTASYAKKWQVKMSKLLSKRYTITYHQNDGEDGYFSYEQFIKK